MQRAEMQGREEIDGRKEDKGAGTKRGRGGRSSRYVDTRARGRSGYPALDRERAAP